MNSLRIVFKLRIPAVSSGNYGSQIRAEVASLNAELEEEASEIEEELINGIGQGEHAEDAIHQAVSQIGGRIISIAWSGPLDMCGSCANVVEARFKVWIGK